MTRVYEIIRNRLKSWLSYFTSFFFSIYIVIACLSIYPVLYAYNNSLVGTDSTVLQIWSIDYKLWLIIAQTLGYTLVRFLKQKIAAVANRDNIGMTFLQLTGVAGCSLLFFTLVPTPLNIPFLFSNGLSLGIIWTVIFSNLHGIKLIEVLSLGLGLTLIF